MKVLPFLAVGALAALASPAWAQPTPAPTSCVVASAPRALCHELVVPASAADAWALMTTTDGLASWLAPVVAIDLRIGGDWEASYTPGARLGDAGNIHNRVLSFLPERMLSIAIAEVPTGFPHADAARQLWTVMAFEPVDATHTRVRVAMLGYAEGEAFDVLRGHFERGNSYTLIKLRERIVDGPTDWARVMHAPANAGDVP
jgi:uncharacterized protein YndB with AHSA1/START domain